MSGSEKPWKTAIRPELLSGDERIEGTGTTVLDFWRWAYSYLVENKARGVFAEFLVARAVGDAIPVRDGWAFHDVTMPASGDHDEIKIEVKCGAYLQGWKQKGYSTITFTGLRSWAWYGDTPQQEEEEPEYHADVYVFAVHTCKDPEKLDLLDVTQWDFRVLSRSTLQELGTKSISWSRVQTLAPTSLEWKDLASAVREAASTGRTSS